MKKNMLGILMVGAFLVSCAVPAGATAAFPDGVATSYTDQATETTVSTNGDKLLLSIKTLQDSSMKTYVMDVTQGTIEDADGVSVGVGQDGFSAAYASVMSSLTSVRDGLTGAGDTANADAVTATIAYLQTHF